jgi:dTDP-4-amino-4,6-dideoxygalactose transaminase
MLNTFFSPWPSFSEEEIEAVSTLLRSGRVSYWTGDECRQFEKEFADWCGTKYAVSLANGTVALDLALKVLGIGAGDEVVVTPRTFLATASAVVNAGARPVFADVDRDSQNVTAETIAPLLSSRTKAILCVHIAGWPCEMDSMLALAKENGLYVIEDCAQAHGAKFRGQPVGSLGLVAAWSFCQDKIMTTGGEGGMLTTNDAALWQRAWSYKDHGKSWDAVYNREHLPGFRWLHESFGTNWRMTEMQAAIGRIQLKRMPAWHAARRHNAQAILDAARSCAAFRVPVVPDHLQHAWYKAHLFVEPGRLKPGWDRDRIMAQIDTNGVPCAIGGCSEVYLERAFDETGFRPATRLPIARELGENGLMFLVHPTLTAAEIGKTCQVIRDVGRMALA